MEVNNTTNPPRSQNKKQTIVKEEKRLGIALSSIRTKLINPYNNLETEEEKEEFKRLHPELKEVKSILDEIDYNNIADLKNARRIEKWMENNDTTTPPRSQNKNKDVPEEEVILGNALARLRHRLVTPYNNLETEEEKEEYRKEHPELEEVKTIVEEIDYNNITELKNAREIKKWMKKNNTTTPPRPFHDNIEYEEATLGNALSHLRKKLINPYNNLQTEEKKEEFKRLHPELEEVKSIIDSIDYNNNKYLKNIKVIKKWMSDNNTTKPPRAPNKDVSKEEASLGDALGDIRKELINPYNNLETEEEKEKFERKNPVLKEVKAIVEEIDYNNSVYLKHVKDVQNWMKKNNTKRLPRSQNKSKIIPKEEASLRENFRLTKKNLIKPYYDLKTEKEKEEYRQKHPELEEVIEIIDEIEKNKITRKDLKSVVVSQKEAGKIGENLEIDRMYAEEIQHAQLVENSIEK